MGINDVDGLTDEQLEEALLRSGMPDGVEFTPTETSEPSEPEPEPVKESEAPQEVAAEEQAPEPQAEPEQEQIVPELDDVKARLDAAEARAKHWEAVAGRTGGRLGFLEQKMRELEQIRSTVPDRQESDEAEYGERPPVQSRPVATPPAQDPFRTWALQRSIADTTADFANRHSDAGDHAQVMAEYLQKTGYSPETILASGDPVSAAQATERILEEAYWHAKAVQAEALRVERATKRAEQLNNLAEAKRKASISATASSPPPKPRPKTTDEMTDAEIEAELLKATGGRW